MAYILLKVSLRKLKKLSVSLFTVEVVSLNVESIFILINHRKHV